MIKTCAQIEAEINDVRKLLQQQKSKVKKIKMVELSEQQKCDSESSYQMCSHCTCWKSAREYCS